MDVLTNVNVDGTVEAKKFKGDLEGNADSATNADMLDGWHAGYNSDATNHNGRAWGFVPVVKTDGVMDIGKYLDFHSADKDTSTDYSVRLTCNGNDLSLNSHTFTTASGAHHPYRAYNMDTTAGTTYVTAHLIYAKPGNVTDTVGATEHVSIDNATTQKMQIGLHRWNAHTNKGWAYLGIHYDRDNDTTWGFAPSTPSGATGTEIVTADWAIGKLNTKQPIGNYALKSELPTVNNGQLTIQKNGTQVATFTANQSGNSTANITVPTALSDLTSDSTHRLVTDTEKSTWNGKQDAIPANTYAPYNANGYLPLSGGTITESLTIDKNLSVKGNITMSNGTFSGLDGITFSDTADYVHEGLNWNNGSNKDSLISYQGDLKYAPNNTGGKITGAANSGKIFSVLHTGNTGDIVTHNASEFQKQLQFTATIPTDNSEGDVGDVRIVPDETIDADIDNLKTQVSANTANIATLTSNLGNVTGDVATEIQALKDGKSNVGHTHNLSSLTDDATHRLVTDTEKSTWNGKQGAVTVSDPSSATATLTHTGTFSAITGLTRDTNGHITGYESTTFTMPTDANNYARVRGYFTDTENEEYPILTKYTAGATSSYATEFTRYINGFTINPSKKTLSASAYTGTFSGLTASGNVSVGGNLNVVGSLTQNSATVATETYVNNKVSDLVSSAPETLDTLNELATALGNDPNFATTVAENIGTKVAKSGDTMTGILNLHGGATLNSTTAESSGLAYVLGIKAFAQGGNIIWSQASRVGVGSATKATQDASGNVITTTYATKTQLTDGSVTKIGTGTVGSSSQPIYLNAGTPTRVTTTRLEGSTIDLNSYRTTGWWNTKGTVLNSPLALDGYLKVQQWNSGTWCQQMWISGNYDTAGYQRMYIRSCKGGDTPTWTAWTEVATLGTVANGKLLKWDNTNGRIVDSGYTIATSVPANAVFTDHYAWSDITGKPDSFPPASHTHSYLPLSGGTLTGNLSAKNGLNWKNTTWEAGGDIRLNATADGNEWSFDIYRNEKTGCLWHVWDSDRGTMLGVSPDSGIVSAPYGFSGNLTGTASWATGLSLDNKSSADATVEVAKSVWTGGRRADTDVRVWSQKWKDSGLSTDTGDMVLWLHKNNTASELDICIDGRMYAGQGFKGNLDGNAATATTATGLSATIANDKLPVRLQEYQATKETATTSLLNGFHYINNGTDNPYVSLHTSDTDYRILSTAYSANWGTQIASDFRSPDLFVRRNENKSWKPWGKVHVNKQEYYTINATGYKVLAMMTPDHYWRANNGSAHLRVLVSTSNIAFATGTAALTQTTAATIQTYVADIVFSGINGSATITSENQSAGTGATRVRYFAFFAPKTTAYGPRFAVALDTAGTNNYVKVEIIDGSLGWYNPSGTDHTTDPGTTNYNRTLSEVGRYNYAWSTNKIAANITGTCDGTAGSSWDSIRFDRYQAGSTNATGYSYPCPSAHIIGVATDGCAYTLSDTTKAFKLPFEGGRAGENSAVNDTTVYTWKQTRGCVFTELTTTMGYTIKQDVSDTIGANAAAVTTYRTNQADGVATNGAKVGEIHTITGNYYYNPVLNRFSTAAATGQYIMRPNPQIRWDGTTWRQLADFGDTLYIIGSLDAAGNFKPDASKTICTRMQAGYTNLRIGDVDSAYDTSSVSRRFTVRCNDTHAYTLNSDGVITHIDGKPVTSADYSTTVPAASVGKVGDLMIVKQGAVGDSTHPVYVDANGEFQRCGDALMDEFTQLKNEAQVKSDQISDYYNNAVAGGLSALVKAMYPVGSIQFSTTATNPNSAGGAFAGMGMTWVAFGAGRVPVGVGSTTDAASSTQTLADAAEKTGGRFAPSMPSHHHSLSTEAFAYFMGPWSSRNHTSSAHMYCGSSGTSTGDNARVAVSYLDNGQGRGSGDGTWAVTSVVNGNSLTHLYHSNGTVLDGYKYDGRDYYNNTQAQHEHTHYMADKSSGDTTKGNAMPYIGVYMWKRTA